MFVCRNVRATVKLSLVVTLTDENLMCGFLQTTERRLNLSSVFAAAGPLVRLFMPCSGKTSERLLAHAHTRSVQKGLEL